MTKLLSCGTRMMLHLAGLLWAVCKQWIKNKIDWKANIYFEMALQKVVTMEKKTHVNNIQITCTVFERYQALQIVGLFVR